MKCGDCQVDGKNVTVVFDAKFMGLVCPRCGRIHKPGQNPMNFEFVDEKSCKRRIRRDLKANAIRSESTLSLVDRILKGDK